jgi:putative membrane protein
MYRFARICRWKERTVTVVSRLAAAAAMIAALPAAIALAQQQQGRPYMMYGYDGFGWAHGIFGLFMMVLFWGGLIALVFLAVRWLSTERGQQPPWPSRQSSALSILEERFARGEIDKDEFLERKRHLTD